MLVLVAVVISTVTAEYYVNLSAGEWDHLNPPCDLATPEIKYSSTGQTVKLEPDVMDMIDDKPVSVGYTLKLEVFEYVGCIKQGDLPGTVWRLSTLADPGRCFSACQTKNIGIYKDDCFCNATSMTGINDTNTHCDLECSNQKETLCGGAQSTSTSNLVSLYKKVTSLEKSMNDGKFCRSYNYSANAFEWKSCDSRLVGLCWSRKQGIDFTIAMGKNMKAWHEYPNECYHTNTYPATENKSGGQNDKDDKKQYWIGRVKSWVIANIKGVERGTFCNFYGHIRKDEKGVSLDFDNKTSQRVLCNNDTTQSTSSTTSTTTRSSADVINALTVRVALVFGIPLVLVIGVVIAVLVCLWRRQQARTTHPHNVAHSNGNNTKQLRTNVTAVTNSAYSVEFFPFRPESGDHEYSEIHFKYDNSATKGATMARPNDNLRATANRSSTLTASSDKSCHVYFVLEKTDTIPAAPIVPVTVTNHNLIEGRNDTETAEETANMHNTYSECDGITDNHSIDGQTQHDC